MTLYLDAATLKTLKRFAVEDDRSLHKTIQRIIASYLRERLVRNIDDKLKTTPASNS